MVCFSCHNEGLNIRQVFIQLIEEAGEVLQTVTSNYHGVLYPASTMSKAMIIVTGSDGGSRWANEIAQAFSARNIPSFALSYWKDKGLSKTLSMIPIEIVRSAAQRLREQRYEKIGIYGISKGAELALTSASLLPEIEFVIAASPSCCVFEGIAKPKYSGSSSWTWQGKPLDFAGFSRVRVNILHNIIKNHEFGFTPQYREVLAHEKNERNTIKVERINGPILLLSAQEDAQWPSAEMGKMIADRLERKQFAFSFRHEIFHPASHILCPVKSKQRIVYRMERKHPLECNAAREQALRISLDWLEGV